MTRADAHHEATGGAHDSAPARPVGGRLRRAFRLARRRAKLCAGLAVVVAFYAVAVLADFLAPNDYRAQSRREPSAPASVIRFRDAGGRLRLRPFVYARHLADPLQRRYVEDTSRAYPLALFARGYTYKLFGLFPTDRHLVGVLPADANRPAEAATGRAAADRRDAHTPSPAPADVPRLHLLGTDGLGRDRLSRLLVASRFSLTVGPLGTVLACALGVFVGCVSGYAGRAVDTLLMRAADTVLALPTLVIVLAARAAFPLELPPARAVVLLVGIFVTLGWAEMSILTRGVVSALRRREFVQAARALGLSEARVLFRHVLPNAARPLVVQTTLMLPAFLLTETAVSFLGVGVQEPEPSWGNMLAEATDITLLRRDGALLLLAPAFAIFLFSLGARLLGEGLRRDEF